MSTNQCSAEAAMRAYYAALDAGDIEGAASCFAADAVYVRPETVGISEPGVPRRRRLVSSRGRDEIRRFIAAQAAAAHAAGREIRHSIDTVLTSGRQCSVLGVVHSGPAHGDTAFIALAALDAACRVERYVAVANEVPGHLAAGLWSEAGAAH